MKENRKSQVAGGVLLIGISLLAILLIFSLNSLGWPIGQGITKIGNVVSVPQNIPYGTLLVQVESNETVLPNSAVLVNQAGFYSNTRIVHIPDVPISIQESNGIGGGLTNYTNYQGQIQETLPPTYYTIKISDWRFDNLTLNVQVLSNRTTFLKVTLDATAFKVESFNVADPDGSGWAVGWENIFAQVQTPMPVASSGSRIFLDIFEPPAQVVSSVNRNELTPVSVTSSTMENQSQWVSLQLSSPINIHSIQTLSLFTLKTNYTVTTLGSS